MRINIADIIMLVVLIAGFIMGKRHGFIKSAVNCMVYAGSFLISALFARMLADAVFQAFIYPRIEAAAARQIEVLTYAKTLKEVTASDIISSIIDSMPALIQPFFQKITAAPGSFNWSSAESLASSVSAVFKPAIMPFLNHLSFMVLFTLSAVAAKVIATLAKIIRKIPGMGKIDHSLGGCLGMVTVAACSAFAVKVLLFLSRFPSMSDSVIMRQIAKTINLGVISGFFAKL